MKIAIAGGGIGGLTLALALNDAGFDDVHVYESAAELKELGVGINMLPHATRELAELGLLEDLAATGIATVELAYYTKRGQRIWSEPRGVAAGYQWPQFSIHRGELLGLLHRAVLKRLGPSRVHAGHRVVRAGNSESGAWAEFFDPSLPRAEADLLVACDGVHSVIRAGMYPDEGPPKWNGIVMWRGVTRAKPFLTGRTMIMAGTIKQRVVVYPISKKLADQGEALINWVAELKIAENQPMPRQDWTFTTTVSEVLPHFESFRFDFLDVPALIRGAEAVFQYPMVDRDMAPTWNNGRLTLLGDAAHPMYPVGSNGATQAILDARILARELVLQPSIEAALTSYDALRRPATGAIVEANRKVGPELAMEIVEERAPDGFTALDDIISQQELEEISRKYKKTAGFDPATLNARPSFSVRRANQ